MYRPNFCAECGAKVLRLHWHAWTSRRFCDNCARRLRKERLIFWLVVALALLSIGFITGRATRSAPRPLIIERSPPSTQNSSLQSTKLNEGANPPATKSPDVYLCGARTKKGKPCSRRVQGPVRCWQHKGSKAMLPDERLIVKEEQ